MSKPINPKFSSILCLVCNLNRVNLRNSSHPTANSTHAQLMHRVIMHKKEKYEHKLWNVKNDFSLMKIELYDHASVYIHMNARCLTS